MQHVRGHYDHMHVRFYTPWSTMAARVGEEDAQQRSVIELAQQAYLPKKVNYIVKVTDNGLEELARSFGVNQKDLCRWNQMTPNDALKPGSCLVFYKRSFEVEPVHLARSLQPDSVPDSPGLQFASTCSVVKVSNTFAESRSRGNKSALPVAYTYYTVHRGDTLQKVAQHNGVDLKALCNLNGLKPNSGVRPGQKIKLVNVKSSTSSAEVAGSSVLKSVHAVSVGDLKPSKGFVPAVYTAEKHDTLQKIAKQQGIDLNALCQLNGLNKNTTLKAGQKIRLCGQEASQKTAPSSASMGKASVRSSAKKDHSQPSTLQKNMKPVPGSSVKAGASQQKTQGFQKNVTKVSAKGISAQQAKIEKKPSEKP